MLLLMGASTSYTCLLRPFLSLSLFCQFCATQVYFSCPNMKHQAYRRLFFFFLPKIYHKAVILYDLSQYTQSIEQRKRKKYICIRIMTISYMHNRLFILYVDYSYAQGPRKRKEMCTPLSHNK